MNDKDCGSFPFTRMLHERAGGMNPRLSGMPPHGLLLNDEDEDVVLASDVRSDNRGAPVGTGEVGRYRRVPLG